MKIKDTRVQLLLNNDGTLDTRFEHGCVLGGALIRLNQEDLMYWRDKDDLLSIPKNSSISSLVEMPRVRSTDTGKGTTHYFYAMVISASVEIFAGRNRLTSVDLRVTDYLGKR